MASSSSSSSGNPTSSLPVPSSLSPHQSSPNPLPSAAPLTLPLPISSLTSTLPFPYLSSEISQPMTTSIPMSIPPTPSISKSHPLFSGLHQQQMFPTSTASFWTQPQPVIPRAMFPPITTPIGIDQIAYGLHGLNLSGGVLLICLKLRPSFLAAYFKPFLPFSIGGAKCDESRHG